MTKLQDFKDATARMTEAARRLEACTRILVRGNVTSEDQREMDAVLVEHKAAKSALAKAQKAMTAALKGGS